MPRLWADTLEEHRSAVRSAALRAVGTLVAEVGLSSVTMSAVADAAGVGRATLYKHFPDLDAILLTWHEQQLTQHLDQLVDTRDSALADRRLVDVLQTYAALAGAGHNDPIGDQLHRHGHADVAWQRLHHFLTALLADEADAGRVRTDIPAAELATYVSAALSAARTINAPAGRRRLVQATLSGLQPEQQSRRPARPATALT